MSDSYFIASCVFSQWHPKLSPLIWHYVRRRGLQVVRCCMPDFRVAEYEALMPEVYRDSWKALPVSASFHPGDNVYSICHNCTNFISDTKSHINTSSLWELIVSDSDFKYPDFGHKKVYLQHCWRSAGLSSEHAAIRLLLKRMNLDVTEISTPDENEFCGRSYYQLKSIRKSRLAPANHPVITTPHKPLPTKEEQQHMMELHCEPYMYAPIICYCHYCLEGLLLGGANAYHLATLLFDPALNF